MDTPHSVVFSGYYGMSNFGDDVFAAVCMRGAQVYWGVVEPSYMAPPIEGVDGRCVVRATGFFRHFSSPGFYGRMARGLALWKGIGGADMFVLGGGSILSNGVFGTRDIVALASTLNRLRLSAVGVSVGPFESMAVERSVKRFLRQCEFLSVRDRFSYEVAMQLELPSSVRVVAGLDLAGNYPAMFNIPNDTGLAPKAIGVALCRYESLVGGDINNERERLGAILSAAKDLAISQNRPVYVFSLNGHPVMGDQEVSRKAHARLKAAGVEAQLFEYPLTDMREVWQSIRSCAVMLTVRLHGAIAAYLEGVPVVLAEYHQKCADFLEDIGQPDHLRVTANARRSHIASAARAALSIRSMPSLSAGEYAARARSAFVLAPWASNEAISAKAPSE
jgi:polysaccharide pyruvyl transferase WcaK-like protein